MSCLLKEGLQAKGQASAEMFESVLTEADVPDRQWHLGNYEILEEIGRGGMGVIYRARQRHSRRILALKRMLTYQADSHETLARFRREAEAATSLDHPNILPTHEVSEEDGLPFFSMKLATGGSLRTAASALREKPRDAVRLMAKVARAIEYAHGQGILHRDLQPGNILLDARGEPLVSDFGLAKWLGEETDLTRTLTTFGTPGYIAPEQAEGAIFSPAADIYSLGAILFSSLTGRTPFIGANALSVIRQAAAAPAPKLRSFVPSLGRDLETIVARCLERDPKARYQTAGAVAEDLERWLEGRPILARPMCIPARVWRWSRRNPVLASAGTVCLLLGGTVLWLLYAQVSNRPESSAPEKSIAVLPFENLSNDKDNSYFAVGIQDEILSDLAKVADLKVISRTSSRVYEPNKPRNLRQIGQELGVANLLEGSVQRIGQRLRINAQLIDARSDSHLWAQTYDREVADVFAIQSEIAQGIAHQLRAKISASEKAAISRAPTSDLVANDLYLRGVALEYQMPDKPNLLKGIDLLEQAIARDPHFVRAYCVIARFHLHLYEGEDHTAARLQSADTNIAKAAQLAPDSGEVHAIRAHYLARGLRDYDAARAELELARRALPNDPAIYFETALMDRRQGRWAEALRNFERAVELDPRNMEYITSTASSYSSTRHYARATELARHALTLTPHDDWTRRFIVDLAFMERADLQPFRTEFRRVLAEEPATLPQIADWLWEYAIYDRDSVAADRAVAAMPPEGLHAYLGAIRPREFYVGYTASMFNGLDAGRPALMAASTILEKHLRERPDEALAWSFLGRTRAMLGEREQAIKACQHACDLWPLSKEPLWGLKTIRHLAAAYACLGERNLALRELSLHVGQPEFVDYGELKLDPAWDPLRGDPRFEKIVSSLAPK